MIQLKIDSDLRDKLMKCARAVELIDEGGTVLGTFMPLRFEPHISEDELQRREQEHESFTTAEVLAHLEKL